MQVSENDKDVRRVVQKKFNSRCIYLSKDSLTFLTDFVKSLDHDTREKVLGKLIEEAGKNSQSQSESLDVTKLKEMLSRGTKSREIDKDILFKLENAFDWKRIVLDKAAKKLTPLMDENFRSWEKSTTFDCLRQRFEMVRQLLIENSGCVSSIDSLFTHRDEEVRILGMLSRGAGDSLIAEDLSGTVLLDMSDVKYNPGLYFEGGIYVFLGNYEAGRLYVENISLPVLKNIAPSQMMSAHLNIPKGVGPNVKDQIVLMSDVHLDNPRVMKALHKLFTGFAHIQPSVFILCGRFLSTQLAHGYTEAYSTAFRHLANLLASFSSDYAGHTDFILVPSIEDPLPMTTLPHFSLPSFVREFFKNMPNVHFPTNPCKLTFKGQTIVICRDDIVEKLCRSSIYVPEKVEDIPKYFCDTVWSQTHFSPLPLHFNAVIPQYDYLFHLWPTPDVLVIADKYKSFAKQDSDHSRITINPGSFPLSKFEFQVYYPATKAVEESTLEVD